MTDALARNLTFGSTFGGRSRLHHAGGVHAFARRWVWPLANAPLGVVDAALAVSNSGPATAIAGNNVNYTLTLTNNGPNALPTASRPVSNIWLPTVLRDGGFCRRGY